MKKQAGFTLVEIAIVMVIIGLLLGGVLKGREIITNAKIKNLENDFNGITAAIYNYQDRYRALPGDDKGAKTRFALSAAGPTTQGNGKIEGNFDSTTETDESRLFWLHMRNAGLVAGNTTDTQQPTNAFNGLTGVSTGITISGGGIAGLVIAFGSIPSDIAKILESHSDDGEPKTGTIQGLQRDAGGATAEITDYNTKTVLYNLYFSL